MANKNFNMHRFLEVIADSSGMAMPVGANYLVERFTASQPLPKSCALTTFMVDFATKKYIYVNPACINLFGYTSEWMMEQGLEEYLKKWHPADFAIYSEKVFADNIQFLRTVPQEKYLDIIFSYNYRVLNPKGVYVTVLQRCSFVPGGKAGLPLGMLGVAFDITHFKNDKTIVHTIEKAVPYDNKMIHELLFKKVHPVIEEQVVQLLSKKEKEILQYLAEGLSSKQIACKTHLSINTINNHRKNMLYKTNCKSSSELMNYAVKHGLV